MAYYSFYKIFKDIIKTIFGRKVWRFLLIVFIIFTIFFIWGEKTQVFGAFNNYDISNEINVTINSTNYTITVPAVSAFDFSDVTAIYGLRDSSTIYFYVIVGYPNSVIKANIQNNILTYRSFISADSNTLLNENNSLPFLYRFNYNFLTNTYNNGSRLYSAVNDSFNANSFQFCYATKNILNTNNNNIFFAENGVVRKPPELSTSLTSLENLDFQVLSIDSWDYSNKDLYLLFYNRSYSNEISLDNLYPVNVFLLNSLSSYYMEDLSSSPDINKIYWIPANQLNTTFKARWYLWV